MHEMEPVLYAGINFQEWIIPMRYDAIDVCRLMIHEALHVTREP